MPFWQQTLTLMCKTFYVLNTDYGSLKRCTTFHGKLKRKQCGSIQLMQRYQITFDINNLNANKSLAIC